MSEPNRQFETQCNNCGRFARVSLPPLSEMDALLAHALALMPCGHPAACVSDTDEGTSHCAACEREAKAVAAEREACAQLAEAQPFAPDTHTGTRQAWVKAQIAVAIRSRGQR